MARIGIEGLSPGAKWLLSTIERDLGEMEWVEGYRDPDGTEHSTRRALDLGFPHHNKARADQICDYLMGNGAYLGIEGIICWAGQTGYGSPLGVDTPTLGAASRLAG